MFIAMGWHCVSPLIKVGVGPLKFDIIGGMEIILWNGGGTQKMGGWICVGGLKLCINFFDVVSVCSAMKCSM